MSEEKLSDIANLNYFDANIWTIFSLALGCAFLGYASTIGGLANSDCNRDDDTDRDDDTYQSECNAYSTSTAFACFAAACAFITAGLTKTSYTTLKLGLGCMAFAFFSMTLGAANIGYSVMPCNASDNQNNPASDGDDTLCDSFIATVPFYFAAALIFFVGTAAALCDKDLSFVGNLFLKGWLFYFIGFSIGEGGIATAQCQFEDDFSEDPANAQFQRKCNSYTGSSIFAFLGAVALFISRVGIFFVKEEKTQLTYGWVGILFALAMMAFAICSRQGGSAANQCADDDGTNYVFDDALCSGHSSGSFFAAVGGVISLAGVVVTIMNYRSGDLISTKFVRSTFFLGFTFIFAAYLSATSGSAEAADDYDDYVYAGDTIGSVLTGISVLLGFIAVTVDVLTKSKNEPLAENVV